MSQFFTTVTSFKRNIWSRERYLRRSLYWFFQKLRENLMPTEFGGGMQDYDCMHCGKPVLRYVAFCSHICYLAAQDEWKREHPGEPFYF